MTDKKKMVRMIKHAALLLLLSMLSFQAQANTWLCIAERAASVEHKNDKVLSDQSGVFDEKFLVDESGFREFGRDDPLLASCRWIDGHPISCKHSDPDIYNGYFEKNDSNVFLLIYVLTTEDGVRSDTVVKGKCSKISD